MSNNIDPKFLRFVERTIPAGAVSLHGCSTILQMDFLHYIQITYFLLWSNPVLSAAEDLGIT